MEGQRAAAFDAGFPREVGAVALAEEVVGGVIALLDFLNAFHGFSVQLDGAVAEEVAQAYAQFFHTEGKKIFQQRHAASHAFHPLALEFGNIGVQGQFHAARVGVVEHCAVNDVAVGQVVKGVAANLAASLEHNVVAPRNFHIGTKLAKGRSHGLGIVGKQRLHGAFTRDEAPHDVAAVGKDGPATALAAHHIDAFFAAEVEVYLLVGHLVAAHDYCGVQLPGKQVVVLGQHLGNVFLSRQIEGSAAVFGFGRQLNVARGKVRVHRFGEYACILTISKVKRHSPGFSSSQRAS